MTEARVLAAGVTWLILLAPGVVAARDRSPTEVLNAPGRFDGQTIVLAGTISNVKERQTAQGQRYYLFDVDDGIRAINVIKVGVLPCGVGGYAVIEGAFQRTREFEKETFRNQIKAWRVVCR
jgi:hypothetical protein